jgi:hypothetical protein
LLQKATCSIQQRRSAAVVTAATTAAVAIVVTAAAPAPCVAPAVDKRERIRQQGPEQSEKPYRRNAADLGGNEHSGKRHNRRENQEDNKISASPKLYHRARRIA